MIRRCRIINRSGLDCFSKSGFGWAVRFAIDNNFSFYRIRRSCINGICCLFAYINGISTALPEAKKSCCYHYQYHYTFFHIFYFFSACAQLIISATSGNFKQCMNVNLSFQHPPMLGTAQITLPEKNTAKALPSTAGSNNFHVFPLSDDLKIPSG